MSRLRMRWRDAVLGVLKAAWLATQLRNNDAMRPSVNSEMGYWQFPHPLLFTPNAVHRKGPAKTEFTVNRGH